MLFCKTNIKNATHFTILYFLFIITQIDFVSKKQFKSFLFPSLKFGHLSPILEIGYMIESILNLLVLKPL
jgi:hypothetical protein